MIIIEVKFVDYENKMTTQFVEVCGDNTWEIEQAFELLRNLTKEEAAK